MEQPATQTDLFDKDPLAAGTDGQGGNPSPAPSGGNRNGENYWQARRDGNATAERRRRQMTEGLTLTEATGYAIIVLRKLSAADRGHIRRAAEERAGSNSAITGGRSTGNGLKG